MKKRLWFISLAILLAVLGGLAAFWPFQQPQGLRFSGVVEIQEVRLGSKVGGRVEAVWVNEGDEVYKNQLLVTFEAPELKNQRDQMQARLRWAETDWIRTLSGARYEEKEAAEALAKAARARYERVQQGPREEEKQQARSDLESAEADYDMALKEWIRVSKLFPRQAISRSDFEAALATRDRFKGRVDSARAKAMMMKGSRQEDIDEAKADWERARAQSDLLNHGSRWEEIAQTKSKVDELQSNIEAIDINLKETAISVPTHLGRAVVEVIAIRPGDLVAANQPVIRVLRHEDLWVKIFVPETQYGLVTLGKKVDVTIDSHPGKIFHGVIQQRMNISEFTPRNVQSLDERRHQVFGVKVRVEEAQRILNAGMAAEVFIPFN